MTRYKVDLDQLDSAIETMAAFGRFVDDATTELDRHIADLHLSWASSAAEAQRVAHDRWNAGAQEMRENLTELRDVARTAHANYSAAVSTNTRMWP